MNALMPGSRGLTAIRLPCAAGGVALFLVTSPAARAATPLVAAPVPHVAGAKRSHAIGPHAANSLGTRGGDVNFSPIKWG